MDSIARFYANSSPFSEGGNVEECRGWKVGYLENVLMKQVRGISGISYHFNDRFTCKKNHSEITYGCNCGFYSFKEMHNAINLKSLNRKLLVFKVENFGDILEFEEGFVSEEQDIAGIHLSGTCSKRFCKAPVANLAKVRKFYIPTCKKHSKGLFYSLSELSLLLNAPVVFLP